MAASLTPLLPCPPQPALLKRRTSWLSGDGNKPDSHPLASRGPPKKWGQGPGVSQAVDRVAAGISGRQNVGAGSFSLPEAIPMLGPQGMLAQGPQSWEAQVRVHQRSPPSAPEGWEGRVFWACRWASLSQGPLVTRAPVLFYQGPSTQGPPTPGSAGVAKALH